MLGGQPALRVVKIRDPARRHQEGFEQGSLAVLVQVSLRVGDRLGNVLAEPGVVLFIAAFGSHHDHTVGR